MRVAVPKGRLAAGVMLWFDTEPARQVFGEISFPNERSYRGVSSRPDVQVSLIKPRAIPQLLSLGFFDVGFCGLDLLVEAAYHQVLSLIDLNLNQVQLRVGVPLEKRGILENPPARPLIIATEYPGMAEQWAFEKGLACIVVQTFGGTEAYVPDIADIVIDCVETGATLEANGLVPVDLLMKSSTYLIASPHWDFEKRNELCRKLGME